MIDGPFPVDNDSACVYKWAWSTIYLYSGSSSSCHRVNHVKFDKTTFNNFHNTPEVLEDRKLMLEGKWPEGRGCEYCKNIESAGGISDRTFHNPIPGLTPADFDGNNLEVNPTILEVFLDNYCDLACVYCRPEYSSRINSELRKFGTDVLQSTWIKKDQDHSEYVQLLIEWLDKNISSLKRLSVLGGEPLHQKEFWKILDFLKTKQNKNLELAINTNLNATPDKIDLLIENVEYLIKKKHIKRFDMNCSLDCWGQRQEFIRYGLSVDRWKNNFQKLMNIKWLTLYVQPTVTNLSIASMREMQRFVSECKKKNPKIRLNYHLVVLSTAELYDPCIFDLDFYKDELKLLLEEFPIHDDYDIKTRDKLEGIVKVVNNSYHQENRLKKLKAQLNQYNIRRSVRWQDIFPEVNDYFEKHGI